MARDYRGFGERYEEYAALPSAGTAKLNKSAKLSRSDMPYIVACILGALYLGLTQPLMASVLAITGATAVLIQQLIQATPSIEKRFKFKIRFWHVAAVMIAAVVLFGGLFDAPAHAQFLSGLEKGITDLIGKSNSKINTDVIGQIFSAIRIVFLLLVVAAGVYAYNQAQQGNDWRPIITQMALGIAIVIALDVMTGLFVGTTTGGGGGTK